MHWHELLAALAMEVVHLALSIKETGNTSTQLITSLCPKDIDFTNTYGAASTPPWPELQETSPHGYVKPFLQCK